MPNSTGDIQSYRSIFEKHKTGVDVTEMTLEGMGPRFKKDRGILSRCLRKLSLDYTKAIAVDPEVRKIILMNIPQCFYRDFHVKKLPKDKMVLFMWEPYIRLRKMYNSNLHSCFSKIYTWQDDLVDNKLYFKFYYPVLRPMIENVVPFEEKKLCVLMSGYAFNSDKYPRKYPNELYSERLKAIEFFEKVGEKGFEFYGRGWGAPPYKSFQGPSNDKLGTIKNFRFSICYENCRDVPGYITEKIFDCFEAGNLPVYWGANNVTDYIPKDCFIDRRDFASLDELYLFLKAMTEEQYEGYLDRIRTYLQSDKAQLYSQKNFEKILLEASQ